MQVSSSCVRSNNAIPSTRRNISTNLPKHAALSSSLPARPTEVLFTPSKEYIEEEELDVDLLPPEQVKLEITDRAAEVSLILLFYLMNLLTEMVVAINEHCSGGEERECSLTDIRRVGRMSWLSVQDGFGEESLTR